MGLHRLLDAWVPADDARLALDPAVVIAAVVANLAIEHRPLYALSEWAAVYEPSLLLLGEDGPGLLNDDRVGRMLDRLFQADRGSLLTELMVGVIAEFGIDCSRLHNDSTSVSVHGTYQAADGEDVAGHSGAGDYPGALERSPAGPEAAGIHPDAVRLPRRAGDLPAGGREHQRRPDPHSHLGSAGQADRRPWLPLCRRLQARLGGGDGSYPPRRRPVHYRAAAQPQGGRGVPRLDAGPRARLGRSSPRARPDRRAGPGRSTCQAPWPSAEGYRVVWVHDSGKRLRDAAARARKIEKGVEAIGDDLTGRLSSPRSRAADRRGGARRRRGCPRRCRRRALGPLHGDREDPGIIPADLRRPAGPDTGYRRIEKKTFEVTCDIDYQQVAYDAVSDGCWPLITNDRDMTGAEVLAAYRYQPNLERRHHLLKGVQDAAPIWIKTIPRIEAIFLCHFIALLIGALIERQIRMAMKAAEIARIPVYPSCAAAPPRPPTGSSRSSPTLPGTSSATPPGPSSRSSSPSSPSSS